MKTYIIDRNIGFVQWISDEPDPSLALAEFDREVGIDPNGHGLDTAEWRFIKADAKLAAEIDAWVSNGHAASDCPF